MRCPECDAEQPERAPFCDQCGYRFRAQETQVEGLPAITAGMLRRAKRERDHEAEEAPTTLVPAIPAPGEDGFVRGRVGTVPEPAEEIDASRELTTQPEGLASVGSYDRSAASLELRTVVEGLPAVTREVAEAARKRSAQKATTTPEEADAPRASDASARGKARAKKKTPAPAPSRPEPPDTAPEAPQPKPEPPAGIRTVGMPAIRPLSSALASSSSSGIIASPPLAEPPARLNRQALLAFGAVWATITAIGALFVYGAYIMQPRQLHDHTPGAAAPSTPISIPAGKARLGLTKQKRAYLLRACYKVATNADEACDEEKLLAGEFPDREVDLPAYRIDSHEVTQTSYEACVAAGKCVAPDYKKCKVYTHQGYQLSMRVPRAMQAPDLPVICVTREQAQAFCRWRAPGGDLPTHDQWERAARGLKERLYPWGETWDPRWANWGELDVTRMPVVGRIDGFGFTSPPGAFPDGKSADGLLDMAGNVAEWVRAEDAPADPKLGFARGGDFTSDPSELRTTIRKKIPVDRGRTDVGFRCAYTP